MKRFTHFLSFTSLLLLICFLRCNSAIENHSHDSTTGHAPVNEYIGKSKSKTEQDPVDEYISGGNDASTTAKDENKMEISGKYNDSVIHEDIPYGHMKKLGEQRQVINGELPVLDYMIGGEDFYEFFIRKRQPVLFKGVTREWVSTKQWKNETFLLAKYSDEIFDVEMGKVYKDSQHPRKTMTMKEFLAKYKNTSSMYLDSPFPQSTMMDDLEVPLMMQCDKLYHSFSSAHLLFSNGSTSCPLHYDGYENFLAVMSGTKVAHLAHPKYFEELYINDFHDFPGLSPVNPENIDLVKYPKFSQVPFHKLTIEAGDLLYIPEGWYHQIRSYDSPNIAVSMWFHYYKNESNDNFRDPINKLLNLAKVIDESPQTIECGNQVVTMLPFDNILLPNVSDKMKAVERDEYLINTTVLYEKVLQSDGVIYVGSDDHWIYAIDIIKGHVKWKVETKTDTGSTCAFSPDGFTVYCGADDTYVRAMHVGNGSLEWAFKTDAPIISSTIVDEEGLIYIGSFDHHMYSIYPNGTLKWKVCLNGKIWSSPTMDYETGMIYIATANDRGKDNIFALRKESGDVIWKHSRRSGVVSSPKFNAISKEVYVCDKSGKILIFQSVSGDITGKFNVKDRVWSTPAVYRNEMLFILSLSGKLTAFELQTRNSIWQLELGESEKGSNSSPYIGKDNILYVGGGNGTVYAIHPDSGVIKWKKDIGSAIFFSSPRLGKNGHLFIGSIDGPLYAIDAISGNIIWSVPTNGPLVGTPLITREFA